MLHTRYICRHFHQEFSFISLSIMSAIKLQCKFCLLLLSSLCLHSSIAHHEPPLYSPALQSNPTATNHISHAYLPLPNATIIPRISPCDNATQWRWQPSPQHSSRRRSTLHQWRTPSVASAEEPSAAKSLGPERVMHPPTLPQ